MTKRVLLATSFVLASWAICAFGGEASGAPLGRPAMSMATGNSGIFDLQTLDFMASHAGIVRLNIAYEGRPSGTFSYPKIVSILHSKNHDLPVLMYTWSVMGRICGGCNIGGVINDGYTGLEAHSALETRRGLPPKRRGKWYIANPQNAYFRHWLIGRIEHYLKLTGANGIFLDATHRTPGFMQGKCNRGAPECSQYHDGIQSLLGSLQKAIRPNLVFFNGLWNRKPGQLQDQLKLLPFTDGAVIEYFGRNPHRPTPSFSEGIAPFLKIIASHSDKGFLVGGRGPVNYTSYRGDYLWQRYLYAAYLMVAGPKTHFHYNAQFTVPSHGRANGMAWYADWDIPLGKPLGPYTVKDGVYARKFSQALALLVPVGAKSSSYHLQGRWFTPAGKPLSGSVTVASGQGLILSKMKPASEAVSVDFSGNTPIGAEWPGAEIKHSKDEGDYLALSRLASAQAWRHDLMLDFEHSLEAPRCVHMRLRSRDASLRLFLVAAVSDTKSRQEHAVVELAAKGAKPVSGNRPAIWFRDTKSYGRRWDYLNPTVSLPADGRWHTVNLCDDHAFSGQSRYSFSQWKYMRILGSVDLAYIRLNNDRK